MKAALNLFPLEVARLKLIPCVRWAARNARRREAVPKSPAFKSLGECGKPRQHGWVRAGYKSNPPQVCKFACAYDPAASFFMARGLENAIVGVWPGVASTFW